MRQLSCKRGSAHCSMNRNALEMAKRHTPAAGDITVDGLAQCEFEGEAAASSAEPWNLFRRDVAMSAPLSLGPALQKAMVKDSPHWFC